MNHLWRSIALKYNIRTALKYRNDMKQTAVEWLREKLRLEFGFIFSDNILEQAKEMEKEQMKYFIQVGYYAHSQGHKKNEELYNYWIDNYNK